MSPRDVLIGAYVDLNVLLAVALATWFLVRSALRAAGLANSPSTQLRLLRCGVLAALLAPILMAAAAFATALAPSGTPPFMTLADYVIFQSVKGKLGLSFVDVETLIETRQRSVGLLAGLDRDLGGALTLFLSGGALVCGVGLLRNVLRLRRTLSGCYVWRKHGRLRLLLSDSVTVPFATRSLRRSYIVLPTDLLCRARDLRFSVAHEAQHLRNGDVYWEFLLHGLKPLLFWNPAWHLWKAQSDRLRELACDRAVLTRKNLSATDYCDFLLAVGRRCLQTDRPHVLATPAAARSPRRPRSSPVLRRRVLALLDEQGTPERLPVVLGARAVLLASVTMTAVAIQQPSAVSPDRLQLSTIVNLGKMPQARPDHRYGLVMAY